MQASELDYVLPPELIAQAPLAERDGARMAVVDIGRGLSKHARILDLPGTLRPSLFIVNDTRVIPARLFARKFTQGRVELLLVEPVPGESTPDPSVWFALARGAKGLRPGMKLGFDGAPLEATIRALREHGEVEIELQPYEGLSVREAIARAGQVPLPPYIRRDPTADDQERYQTIFASTDGSVAAPTAGLHFDPELFARLREKGVEIAHVTLHVGAGTFQPVRVDDLAQHRMHSESYVLPQATADAIAATRARGGRIVAVGTTSLRVLESAALGGNMKVGAGDTALFVTPGFCFRVVDLLITNFHLPKSTLLMLVSAFAGLDEIRAAYRHAIAARYRFFSYGDAMLLHRSRPQ